MAKNDFEHLVKHHVLDWATSVHQPVLQTQKHIVNFKVHQDMFVKTSSILASMFHFFVQALGM